MQRDQRLAGRPLVSLQQAPDDDDLVAHHAAGCGHPCDRLHRLPSQPAASHRPQQRAGGDGGDGRSGASTDSTLSHPPGDTEPSSSQTENPRRLVTNHG